MKFINLAFSLVAAFGSTAAFAQPVTIDFEDKQTPTGIGADFYSGSFGSSVDFFYFKTNAGMIRKNDVPCLPACADNGTKVLSSLSGIGVDYYYSTVVMTRADDGLFSLSSFDGTGSYAQFVSDRIPAFINVVGKLASGATVNDTFEINKSFVGENLQFTTYNDVFKFSKFSNMKSVTFSAFGADVQTNNGFTLDNIVATPVPEPESYAMMLVGVGLIGTVIRRRKSLQA